MKRIATLLLILLLVGITNGCGKKGREQQSLETTSMAVLTLDGNSSNLPVKEWEELQKVMDWMDKDIVTRLRKRDINTLLLKEMKDYSSTMGKLLIVHVDYFNSGKIDGQPSEQKSTKKASLELSYKILDERGALLDEWLDGADSRKGGGACAKKLNKRAVKKLSALLDI